MTSKSLKINQKGNLKYITFPKLEKIGAVRHVFSTRLGGVSTGDTASMNLSFNRDEKETVMENYRILCGAVGIGTEHLVLSHLTHTNNVFTVT